MKRITLIIVTLLMVGQICAQVTIGSTKTPLNGALLDLKDDGTYPSATGATAKRGLGLPRVELQDYASLQMGPTLNSELTGKEIEHTGLVVYNVQKEKCNPTSGVHVWDGAKWQPINAEPMSNRAAPGPAAAYAPNTYVATTSGTLTIPVEKAFAIWDWWGGGNHPEEGKMLTETSADFTGSLSVSVVWQEDEAGNTNSGTVIGTPTLDKTTLDKTAKITIPITGATGNAVIALSDGKGVRWSWHIWVPNSDPTSVTQSYNNGEQTYVFMDRNLGATRNGIAVADRPYTMGAHYQWGRKDPFPGYLKLNGSMATDKVPSNVSIPFTPFADALSLVESSKSTTLAYSIENPLSMIAFAPQTWDWYRPEVKAAIWGSRWGDALDPCDVTKTYRFTYKSEMDPCPAGWRVPSFSGHGKIMLVPGVDVITEPRSPFLKDGVTSPLKGNYTDATLDLGFDFQNADYKLGWFPAAGYRGPNNGLLYPKEVSDPVMGYYWTSSHGYNAASSQAFQFQPDAVRPWENTGHSYGLSVRCVKE